MLATEDEKVSEEGFILKVGLLALADGQPEDDTKKNLKSSRRAFQPE